MKMTQPSQIMPQNQKNKSSAGQQKYFGGSEKSYFSCILYPLILCANTWFLINLNSLTSYEEQIFDTKRIEQLNMYLWDSVV